MLKATAAITAKTTVRTYDFESETNPGSHLAGIQFDGLEIPLGYFDDAERIAACGMLRVAVDAVCEAAKARLAESIRAVVIGPEMAPGEIADAASAVR